MSLAPSVPLGTLLSKAKGNDGRMGPETNLGYKEIHFLHLGQLLMQVIAFRFLIITQQFQQDELGTVHAFSDLLCKCS